ncbi:amidohydrolase family protein [Desulfolutivibrio sulfoxidireducens]|uniref:amidohydrolase family protein n=1 Tax=Desulfolutivibrio sulfoxidireducens TaxID=2773299 RepID=UPI00159EB33F|nr:amidohydrolase family protein [Desulfolutivibrio sulfoxidireducens]QLA17496.1 amidohydrolase family protein [Desulfolutivibrio sulfoxidireducens]
MRINAHSHVFNFKTFLTAEAKKILAARFNRGGLSRPFAERVVRFLEKYMDKATDNRDARRELDDLLKSPLPGSDNLLKFLKIGCRPDIASVTEVLMAETRKLKEDPDEDYISVALMVDVIGPTPSDDDALFHDQYRQTVEQAVRYPGLILPFVAFNPDRVNRPKGENGLEIARAALESGACVGVKLYPSLAEHSPKYPGMKELFELCNELHAPIVMHASDGGFAASKATALRGYPGDWKGLISDNPNVRIDFAHFADEDIFTDPKSAPYRWRNMLLDMIKDPAFGGRVYGDVSYMDEPLGSVPNRRAYFKQLKDDLNNKSLSQNILWGTDYYMIYLDTTHDKYWEIFRYELEGMFKIIAEHNPKRFLGLPAKTGGAMSPNIERHVDFLKSKKGSSKWAEGSNNIPAKWLGGLLQPPAASQPQPPATGN